MVQAVVKFGAAVYGNGRGSGVGAGDGLNQLWSHFADSNKARVAVA